MGRLENPSKPCDAFTGQKPMKSSILPQHEISMIIVIIMVHLVKPSIKPNIKPSPGGCP
jgi:hypothetical protein